MAMIRVGMGETGAAATVPTAGTGTFTEGAKIWLSPSRVPSALTNLWAAAKVDVVGTLTNPGVLGFLAVPAAAILLLVMGMGAAKRRKRNPRRRRVVARRRRANPRRRAVRGTRINPVTVGPFYRAGHVAARDDYRHRVPSRTGDYNEWRALNIIWPNVVTGRPSKKKAVKDYERGYRDGYSLRTVLVGNPKRRRNAGPRSVRRTKKRNPKYEIYNRKTGVLAGREFTNKQDAERWVRMRKEETSLKQYWKVRRKR